MHKFSAYLRIKCILSTFWECAQPAVAYNVAGVPEAVRHGDGGYLVGKGDIEGLASRLKELLENQEKRYKMGECGKRFVIERFSLNSLIIRHEGFYAKALNHLGLRLKNMADSQDRASQL